MTDLRKQLRSIPEAQQVPFLLDEIERLQNALEIVAPELTTKTALEEFGLKIGGKCERIFRTLHRVNGGMVTHERLVDQIYSDARTEDEKPQSVSIISVHIDRLRKALKDSPYHIKSHWGQGYSLHEVKK